MKLKNQGTRLGGVLLFSLCLTPMAYAHASKEIGEKQVDKAAEAGWYVNINRSLLNVDDGFQKNTYFADNNSKSSRVGLIGEKQLDNILSVGGNIEVELISGNSATINQLNRNGTERTTNSGATSNTHDGIQIRQVDTWINSDMGKISLGHGSVASYTAVASDLSGTGDTVGYVGAWRTAGGMYFHDTSNKGKVAGVEPQVGSVFSPYEVNYFTRQSRVRYDTPSFAGFTLSASMYDGANDNADNYVKYGSDVALRYSNCFDGVKLLGAVAYNRLSKGSDKHNQNIWDGSLAALHVDSGINVAVNLAQKTYANPGDIIPGAVAAKKTVVTYPNKKSKFGRVQLGIITDLNCYGNTNFVVDYTQSKNSLINNDKGRGYGVGVVQQLKKVNSEVYFSLRRLKYETPTAIQYDKMLAAMLGIRVSLGGKLPS